MKRAVYWTMAVMLAMGGSSAVLAQTPAPAGKEAPPDDYGMIALDPSASGISAVKSASQLLKAQGPETAIAFFNSVLDETHNAAVTRMIHFELVDLYQQAGRPDMALEQCKWLIVHTPPMQPLPTPVLQVVPVQGSNAAGQPQPQQ
jgi:hypothetical protein